MNLSTYGLNDSYILKGDCLQVMNDIPDNSIDFICADLPFGVSKSEWDIVIDPSLLWSQYWRIAKHNAAVLLFGQDKFSALMMLSDKNHRYNLIWKKTTPTGFFNAKKMPLRSHEDMMVFYRKPPIYNPQKTTGHPKKTSTAHHKRNSKKTTVYGASKNTGYESTERYPTSVWEFKTDKQKSSLHPNQKPVALLEEIIKTYTDPGAIVMDNVSGSGTLGEACVNTGREFILIEKNPKNYEIGKNRVLRSMHNLT